MSSTAPPLSVVVLAAGKGTRMKSRLPKVLQPLAGQPLLAHALASVAALQPAQTVVVVGHGAEDVRAAFPAASVTWALQSPQNGTGHAAAVGLAPVERDGVTLLVTGDTPLIRSETLHALVSLVNEQTFALLTCVVEDVTGYGRIVRDAAGEVVKIVEHKDALAANDHAVLAIHEMNTGIMAAPTAWLRGALARLTPHNAQGELYLTDVIAMAAIDGLRVATAQPDSEMEIAGVNDKIQLAALERKVQLAEAEKLMTAGVTLADPARIDVRGTLDCGSDVFIDVGCVFEGAVKLGDNVRIGPNCVLRDVTVGTGSVVHPMSHLEGCTVGEGVLIGPFARLRPGAALGDEVHIGNFVEVKNSTLAKGAKANHLAYLGDATVGERVNYGAGSITANYDGANKHRTVIEADVHVGSNCVLVAPVTIGAGGTVGGGSTVTKNAPAGALTVARSKPVTIANWKRPQKKT
ncbi:bifunctional UDP-N-acetylglucosamine diphosphorylase/glucosamine-1-phosphate N-acetyltransferase GlmU [Casimicrobium huifangae]|jgi:bifunctional UDP-N-acetylglucosamine pyrophosphorylase/glucosamine-1-phosphate N-acetyltransferase|uniref:bifunctional UDP-N-acetylglucosamine diphosphorylase/glucosamine-1-phosphate N-acetyltransferase GlmU n=1 Tax=Casimicrobium huifangae TaxID=2591109 RepID=UPI0012EC053F|nr:bifunctional UDP-N-acetylglucosamine diphosphorylase/glucosamine-1-phosphate N-acetyltransferase GlmU [Casimicrobium huifangae]